jgi:antitoxin component YwqK of YwqJK toxin-antitoxin module
MKKSYLLLILISFNTYANLENKSICLEEMNISNGLVLPNDSLVHYSGEVLCRYNKNPTIQLHGHLLNGKQHGKWTRWDINEQQIGEANFLNGQVTSSKQNSWYENGQLRSEINYKDQLLSGKTIFMYPDGTIKESYTYKEGKLHGPFFEYNIYGQKIHAGNYRKGKKNGLFSWWYETGQKWVEIKYKNNYITQRKEWNKNGKNKWNCFGLCNEY